MVLPLILAALVLILVIIALAVMYWYITIPILVLWYVYSKRNKIFEYRNRVNKRKLENEFHDAKNTDPKILVKKILKKTRVSSEELGLMLGSGFGEMDSISVLYMRLYSVGISPDKILNMQKYLIPKFARLFEYSYYANYSTKDLGSDFEQVVTNCKRCYEKYVEYQHYKSDSSQYNDYSDWNNYEEKKTYDEYGGYQESRSNNSKSYSSNYNESNEYQKQRQNRKSTKFHSRQKKSNNRSRKDYTSTNYRETKSESLIHKRLAKFGINESEAVKIFGKRWRSKLGTEDWRLFFTIKELEIKVIYDYNSKYKNFMGSHYSKVLEIIKIVLEENAEMNRGYESDRQKNYTNWSYNYGESGKSAYENSNYAYDYYEENNAKEEYEDRNDTHGYSQANEYLTAAYKTLELEPNATMEQIRSNYREMILKNHPDKNNSNDATKKTTEIISAYMCIMNSRNESAKQR